MATIVIRAPCLKDGCDDPVCYPAWQTWLKIDHWRKMQFLAFISETEAKV